MRYLKPVVATALALTITAPSIAKPAWEISPRWTCAEFQRVSCEKAGGCQAGSAQAIVEVDFTAKTIVNFTGGSSALVMRSHYPSRDNEKPGRTYFANDDGQMWVVLDAPREDVFGEGGYPVQSVSLHGSEQAHLYYGECRPR